MSLFVGNISSSTSPSELDKFFEYYGPCKVNFKGKYAFVEFDEERDAEEAIEQTNNKDLGGRPLNVEWSKKSKRFDPSKRRDQGGSPRRREEGCFACGSKNHFIKDCK